MQCPVEWSLENTFRCIPVKYTAVTGQVQKANRSQSKTYPRLFTNNFSVM